MFFSRLTADWSELRVGVSARTSFFFFFLGDGGAIVSIDTQTVKAVLWRHRIAIPHLQSNTAILSASVEYQMRLVEKKVSEREKS